MENKQVSEWKVDIYPALLSKQKEFKLIGYKEVTVDEIWQCLEAGIWKGNPSKRLHEVIQDVFHLSTNTYMNYITVDALKVEKDDLMSSVEALMNNK